jgi:hypothetical protein
MEYIWEKGIMFFMSHSECHDYRQSSAMHNKRTTIHTWICQANPCDSPGYLGWNKKTLKEDFAAVEQDYREEIKAHCLRLKQRLQLLSFSVPDADVLENHV